MDRSVALLRFIDTLVCQQRLDSRWVSSSGFKSFCDVSEVCGWFYTILLPDLLKQEDVSDELRAFIERLIDSAS